MLVPSEPPLQHNHPAPRPPHHHHHHHHNHPIATITPQEGAIVLALSDSLGYIYEPEGMSKEQLEQVRGLACVLGGWACAEGW